MPVFRQKHPKQLTNGDCVGILDADWLVPYIPGDMTNASTFDFPVLYRMMTEVDLYLVVDADSSQLDPIVNAVKDLELAGVRCVSGDCGFFIHYLEAAADAVKIPVILSSLQQLPVIEMMLGENRSIGFICASRNFVCSARSEDDRDPDSELERDDSVYAKAGWTGRRAIVLQDLTECPEFTSKLATSSTSIDADKVTEELVSVCRQMQERNPSLGAFLFECSMLPPYSHAVQAATGLPVFDYVSMIRLFQQATHRKPYRSHY